MRALCRRCVPPYPGRALCRPTVSARRYEERQKEDGAPAGLPIHWIRRLWLGVPSFGSGASLASLHRRGLASRRRCQRDAAIAIADKRKVACPHIPPDTRLRSCSNSGKLICWRASERARGGAGCTSTIMPSAPAARAALATGGATIPAPKGMADIHDDREIGLLTESRRPAQDPACCGCRDQSPERLARTARGVRSLPAGCIPPL